MCYIACLENQIASTEQQQQHSHSVRTSEKEKWNGWKTIQDPWVSYFVHCFFCFFFCLNLDVLKWGALKSQFRTAPEFCMPCRGNLDTQTPVKYL